MWIPPRDAIHAMILELGNPPGFVEIKSVTVYTPQSDVKSFSNIFNMRVSNETEYGYDSLVYSESNFYPTNIYSAKYS